MMKRRQLLKLLSLGVIGHTLDIDRLLWVPGEKTYFLPTVVEPTKEELFLYGVPYHHCDASTGEWLGFSRIEAVSKELIELIKICEESK